MSSKEPNLFLFFALIPAGGALEHRALNAELKTEQGEWAVQGGWNFFPHANLWIDLAVKPKNFRIYLPEPGGNLIAYSYKQKKSDHVLIFKPEKEFGQCSGNLSAKTNAGNNILELNLKKGVALLLFRMEAPAPIKAKIFIIGTFTSGEEKETKDASNAATI